MQLSNPIDLQVLIGIVTGIIAIVGSILKVQKDLDKRFDDLGNKLHRYNTDQQVEWTRIYSKIENHSYLINANTELINHRTQRFQANYEELREEIKELQGFLNKNQGFAIRRRKSSEEDL